MHINNLKIELDPRLDSEEEVFHIGRLRAPVSIDLSEGVTFLIFLSESGEEELQVAVNDRENTIFSRYTLKNNKMKIRLDKRTDGHGQSFYVCKVQHPGKIHCLSEACFIVFSSRPGSEELQITGEILTSDQTRSRSSRKKEIEIVRR